MDTNTKTTENSTAYKEQDSSVSTVKTPLVDALRSYFKQRQKDITLEDVANDIFVLGS